jgi:hypothetical protein
MGGIIMQICSHMNEQTQNSTLKVESNVDVTKYGVSLRREADIGYEGGSIDEAKSISRFGSISKQVTVITEIFFIQLLRYFAQCWNRFH